MKYRPFVRNAVLRPLLLLAVCWQEPALAQTIGQEPATIAVPSLEERELGEPLMQEDERVVYDRALPFLAQDVLDLGFDLPNPYGVQLLGYWQKQDLILDNLFVSINGGPVQPIDFVDFGVPSVETVAVQTTLDAWLFPFMNVYVSLGTFNGDDSIPLAIEGSDLLDFLGFGGLCNGGLLEPELCQRTLTATAEATYEGRTLAIGTNLAMGWRDYFFTLPISYAWSDVSIINETVTALNIGPRFGRLYHGGVGDTFAAYAGATWLRADVNVSGTVSFDIPGGGIPGIGDAIVIDYVIRQRNKDRWNYLLGFNWDASKRWSVQAEAGFGGSRSNFIGSVTYRW